MSTINEKTVIEHVNDFFEGIYDTAIKAPVSFGDFLVRVSGYRDYQFTQGSVLDLDSNIEQTQAINELKILYLAISNESSRNAIKEVLINDIQERPAYYLGGVGTTTAIGKTFVNTLQNMLIKH